MNGGGEADLAALGVEAAVRGQALWSELIDHFFGFFRAEVLLCWVGLG